MMIMQFPVPYEDELLSSILARYVYRQGFHSERVAFESLFSSHKITSSSLFQGHIQDLLNHVNHIWAITPTDLLERHTLMNVFKPFMDQARYDKHQQQLLFGATNSIRTSIGVNTSVLKWPKTFKYCPVCLNEHLKTYGEACWQRLFQLPCVSCCPKHSCLLVDTGIKIDAEHQHKFIQPDHQKFKTQLTVGEAVSDNAYLAFAREVAYLLSHPFPCLTQNQWTRYYKALPKKLNMMHRGKIDLSLVQSQVMFTWSEPWLIEHGLELHGTKKSSWLLNIFREHRRPYNFAEHLVALIGLMGKSVSIADVIEEVSVLPDKPMQRRPYRTAKNKKKQKEYRERWLELLQEHSSLKSIESTAEGHRIYDWLRDFDHSWLKKHSLKPLKSKQRKEVNWKARDLRLVKQLLKVEHETYLDLSLPKKSRIWYVRQIDATNLIPNKLDKLPLCQLFIQRYAETTEEYQVRKITAVIVEIINNKERVSSIYEIKRRAKLTGSETRSLPELIFNEDIPTIITQSSNTSKYPVTRNSRYRAS